MGVSFNLIRHTGLHISRFKQGDWPIWCGKAFLGWNVYTWRERWTPILDGSEVSKPLCVTDIRILFLILHIVLGIVLLAKVSFTSTWRDVEKVSLLGSGIGPINASIAVDLGDYGPVQFWAWYYGLLVSPNYATFIPPIHCSGTTNCASYFLPGTVYDITFPQSFNNGDHPEATALVVQNSVGYQIEFYSLSSSDSIAGAECKVYGYDNPPDSVGIVICLKQSGNDLIAGTPFDINLSDVRLQYMPEP